MQEKINLLYQYEEKIIKILAKEENLQEIQSINDQLDRLFQLSRWV